MASLQDLIPTVNKLQDVMYDSGIDTLDLPILAVVGSQSSGKSSILETLVGKDFLPRGTGIVTRRPLVLQLINTIQDEVHDSSMDKDVGQTHPSSSSSDTNTTNDYTTGSIKSLPSLGTKKSINSNEWAEFLHNPGHKYYDFEEVRKEIEEETQRIAGSNKSISNLPINLKIHSPYVLNLTLVDLPGITKVPIGEQPPDIEKQIKNLILEYIASPNCIILAVSPANVDLVNSESLKLAREVDPQGKRTIGVITKLDLMDSGTNALDILSGKLYPLKLGFVGVVNRSQQDITLNKSVRESLENEENYFNRHPIYRTISNRCGTRYLAKILNQILINHIKVKLPDIKTRLNTLIGQTEQELVSYGVSVGQTTENKANLILDLMNKFASKFISSIDGTSTDVGTKELCGGARIYYIYNDIFGASLKSINPTSNLSVLDIRTAIRNSTGPRASLFVPELAFDLLIKPQIQLLLDPSLRCVELVYEELMKISNSGALPELNRYPKLQAKLVEVVCDLLRERLGPTCTYVESLINIHKSYINTNHPNFVNAADVMADIIKTRKNVSKRILSDTSLTINDTDIKDGNKGAAGGMFSNSIVQPGDDISKASFIDEVDSTTGGVETSKDSFLNYFFGKDSKNGKDGFQPANENNLPFSNAHSNSINIQQLSQGLNSGSFIDSDTDNEFVLTEKEELECELMRRLIDSYFSIIRQMIRDQVPKAIMCFMVNFCKETVQNRLVTTLYKESMFNELLVEDELIAQDREKCLNLLETYKKASAIINNIM
ncbi:hypothetical protein TBLA_0H02850 [Henningerozyma blattae CBS 6284]|uniref:Uncharacterized protein n=1 Tax=Henningerozyma blattae (strain ATCC 34711 / CBS 6284 / DSM 70876 / NBRC 10599 / NRRL Y-10934 / UCD 77-7) TaxID=1071380 RepID=I2H867_HENB6|nr:hypothetical protein TBLA_0H02850 [Tetrapisispora blattae CBS 6284]CCH62569.1 hypothetical protein TBLA_0H02850 [Tetrapisispora blattae CBS 6284]